MVLDYKDVSFSFSNRKARRRRQKLRLALLVFFVLIVFLGYGYLKTSLAVDEIQELLLADRLTEAENRLRAVESSFFQQGNIRELRALHELFQGRLAEAETQLKKLQQDDVSTSLRSGQLLKCFFDRGEYLQLKIYTAYLLPRGDDEVLWFSALCQAAFLHFGESEKTIARLSPSYKKANGKALEVLSHFNRSLRLGRVDYIFDKNDRPLAYFDLGRRVTRSLIPGFDLGDFDAQFNRGVRTFRLTLDSGLQKKVDHLFKDYFGSLVLLDLPENSIAVAYSKPRSFAAANAAFVEQFEPGSITKIISLLAYLRLAEGGLFPLVCPGRLSLGDKVFYDWIEHGQVRDFSQALARSCNFSFARMGLLVGSARLAELLQSFFFNGPPFMDGFIKLHTGSFNSKVAADFQLANLAVGLEEIHMTTIHAAVLAAIFSQSGQLFPPYLIDDVKNILGLGFYHHDARPVRVLADDLNFMRVKKAMVDVVENKNGTGRRARSETVRVAIKTGTAGSSRQGLDAVIIGFFPVEKPRYAFAFRLQGAGKADLNGAFFLRDLLQSLYQK
ncbi:MAG: hypothetical protein KJ808_02975 [Acidobacteria bacterium]|nr:hypothetical protein [Acidobacteriota bacterium]MBU4306249.1 hypothetical protein [Acidobacteriota bacterium]MBU4404141.1 hypothetical protein [Acidobacteriota bacterium]MCG2810852.1 hypothetical protein [Candidatus Aminicenantes bacterium]